MVDVRTTQRPLTSAVLSMPCPRSMPLFGRSQSCSSWMCRPEAVHVEAANAFDVRHRKLTEACEKALAKMAKDNGAPWVSENKERQFREGV